MTLLKDRLRINYCLLLSFWAVVHTSVWRRLPLWVTAENSESIAQLRSFRTHSFKAHWMRMEDIAPSVRKSDVRPRLPGTRSSHLRCVLMFELHLHHTDGDVKELR